MLYLVNLVEKPMTKFDGKFVRDYRNCLKWSCRPTCGRETQLCNGLMLIQKDKYRIILNKPRTWVWGNRLE